MRTLTEGIKMLTQHRLKELLHYNAETGVFIWLTPLSRRVKIGAVAGRIHHSGYIYIGIGGKAYQSHRLAWLYICGNFPEKCIDHINRIKTDNQITNLRLATPQQNAHNVSNPQVNNTSGYRGVHWNKGHKKWVARIKINGKKKHLGYFNTVEQASEAYLVAKKELHPFWKEKVT